MAKVSLFLACLVALATDAFVVTTVTRRADRASLPTSSRQAGSIGRINSLSMTSSVTIPSTSLGPPNNSTESIGVPIVLDTSVENEETTSATSTSEATSTLEPSPQVQPSSWGAVLHNQELRFMRFMQQRLPDFMMPLSLAIHYSLMPKIITPCLAMIAWLVSLPAAASLICFVCAQDIINLAVKWSVNRPRPLWYNSDTGLEAKYGTNSWEADYSFPSAHTQFFSGLAFCACFLMPGTQHKFSWALMASAFGAIIGITRNYLGVHWPTDTTFGLVLGAGLGMLWGTLDPYQWLLRAQSPALSLGFATALTGSLTLLLVIVRKMAPKVDTAALERYRANIYSGLPPDARPNAAAFYPKGSRAIRSKVSMLATVWCTLALTALCPAHLPTALVEPVGAHHRLLQASVGITGLLSFVAFLKKTMVHQLTLRAPKWTKGRRKACLKALAYAGICSWTFILSQIASHKLAALLWKTGL